MYNFSSEDTPLPVVYGFTNTIKESIIAQFYRPLSSNIGHSIIVNSKTQKQLPVGVFNIQQTTLGFCEFLNGNEIKIKKKATYIHTLFINIYSTIPTNGIVAVDIIDKNGKSYAANILATKNITPTSAESLILTCIIPHNIDDTCRLRFGGGEIPTIPSGLNYLGVWISQNYVVNNLVIWKVANGGDDGYYKCILNTTLNQNPGDITYWVKVANAPGSDIQLNITSILWRILEK